MTGMVEKIYGFLAVAFNFVEGEDFTVSGNSILFSGYGKCSVEIVASQYYSKSFTVSWSGNDVVINIGILFEDWAILETKLRGLGIRPKPAEEETEEEGW